MTSINLKNRQILVVEDEEMNWYLLCDIIELYQGKALWADSGMKAIDMVCKNDAIDMVLIDLNLPFMSGTATVKKLKAIRPELPIVAQTAFAEPDILYKSIKAGCCTYILKPIDPEELNKVFRNYLTKVTSL